MRFHALWPLFQTVFFPNSRGLGVVGEEVCSGERGAGMGGLLGNMLRKGESSWSCISLSLPFLPARYFDQGSSAFFSFVACGEICL
jgi:hypothetical protein